MSLQPFPASFYPHTITVIPWTSDTDGSLGPVQVPGTPVTLACCVQDCPLHPSERHRLRNEAHQGVQSERPLMIYFPAGDPPPIRSETPITFNGHTLTALSPPSDRWGTGQRYRVEAVQID